MRLARSYPLAVLLFITLSACHKEEQSITDTPDLSADYFMFGSFFGECLGSDCVQIYLIQDGKLYEDTADVYPYTAGLPYEGSFILLSDALYDSVADIPAAVPEALYMDSLNIFGCPDCHDQGGFLIQLQQDDSIQYFLIDNDPSALPSYLFEFVETLREKIMLL